MSNQTTKYNHNQKCLSIIKDILRDTVYFYWSLEKILKAIMDNLHSSNSWKRLNMANKEYFRGYIDASLNQLYRFDLQWLHFIDNNKGKRSFYDSYDSLPRGKEFKSGYFYMTSKKPFTISQDKNIKKD